MKKMLLAAALLAVTGMGAQAQLIITGVVDGPLTGGLPKSIELFVVGDIADLSEWAIHSITNSGTEPGVPLEEFTLSGSALAGTYIYVASEATEFTNVFGFAPTFTNSVASINGNDGFALYFDAGNDGTGITLIDKFGSGGDGIGQVWEYTDSWAYRVDGTGPDAVFNSSNWTFGGPNTLDGLTAAQVDAAVDFGTFTAVPEPATAAMLVGAFGMLALRRRRA